MYIIHGPWLHHIIDEWWLIMQAWHRSCLIILLSKVNPLMIGKWVWKNMKVRSSLHLEWNFQCFLSIQLRLKLMYFLRLIERNLIPSALKVWGHLEIQGEQRVLEREPTGGFPLIPLPSPTPPTFSASPLRLSSSFPIYSFFLSRSLLPSGSLSSPLLFLWLWDGWDSLLFLERKVLPLSPSFLGFGDPNLEF